MKQIDPSHLTFIAIQAALSAGDLLRKGFGTSFRIDSKPGKQNLVTEYDNASENRILSLISKEFPSHGFLAEESGKSSGSNHDVLWVIDPLDGTLNFAHQIPLFTISIAATVDGKPVSGVIYQPMSQELFVAERGKGSYLNGNRIFVTKTEHLEKAAMATGFPYNVDKNPFHCIEKFAHMTQLGVPIRRLGSAALDLAYVAAGRFDAYWEVSLHPWDMAAGKLLVEEAGGKVTHWDGSLHPVFCNESILATNHKLHETMISHLNQSKPWEPSPC
ncbi:MAG: inositol monophosphatase [Chlamydiales bacterium]|nr:inositol monophosphatase [Chlamydiales bacterium]